MYAFPLVSSPSRVLGGVLSAVDWTYSAGFIHRDIKPENILVSEEGEGILAGFGLILRRDSAHLPTNVGWGTLDYAALEVGSTGSTLVSDLFSVSVCFVELMLDVCPFDGEVSTGVVRYGKDASIHGARMSSHAVGGK